jgi:serine/threonine protein kinase
MELPFAPFDGELIKSVAFIKTLQMTECSVVEKCFNPMQNKMYVRKISATADLFAKEFAIAKLTTPHPNVLRLLDADAVREKGRSRLQYRLLYKYHKNSDVFEFMRHNDRPDNAGIAQIIRDVLSGVNHLHQAGIVHRDLKIENILINNSHRGIVCDFGFCEFYHVDRDYDEVSIALKRKKHPLVVGTIGHIAPEIIFHQQHATPASDVFSLGVVFYELCTGEDAYNPDDVNDERFVVDVESLTFSDDFCPNTKAMILRMLSSNREERPTMQELIDFDWLNVVNANACVKTIKN